MLRIPDLAGKVFLVTGASTGIGAAVAVALGGQAARVIVHCNANREAGERVLERVRSGGGEGAIVSGDLLDAAQVQRVVEQAAGHFGQLDGLINNAGSMLGRIRTMESDVAHDTEVVTLNSLSVVWATRAAHPYLKRSGGVVINTTSIAARNGGGGGAVLYAAAKGFVSTLTRGLAKELVQDGIRVNGVAPGTILTPFHERYSSDAQMAAMVATIPMARAGLPEDCVGAFLFLSSAALSGYITGQIIEVNGGQLMP